jgi:non-homologous end joining protein Ku
VKRKAAGKPVKAVEREERPSNVINLMDALKQSLKGGKGGTKRRGQSTARRSTAHRRPARKAHRSSARQRRAS